MDRRRILTLLLILVLVTGITGTISLLNIRTVHAASSHANVRVVAATWPACSLSSAGLVVNLTGAYKYDTPTCDTNANHTGRCSANWYSGPVLCVYENSNYGGQKITFMGSGCANLTDFLKQPSGTWNDTISSFDSFNNARGAMWWDTSDSGSYYLYGPSPRVTSTSYIGSTWNDQVSSVEMDNSSGQAPSGC